MKEKYDNVFIDVFEVEGSDLGKNFTADNYDGWDSVAQLSLVSALEDEFDIMLETEDMLAINSYESGIEVLKKYNIEII